MIMDSLQLTCLNAEEKFKGRISYSTQQTMSNSQRNQWVLLNTYGRELGHAFCMFTQFQSRCVSAKSY